MTQGFRVLCAAVALVAAPAALCDDPEPAKEVPKKTYVQVSTSLGNFVLELDHDKAPRTVENFLRYVDDGFYEGTMFHRVIKDFMIQGGGFTPEYERKETHDPIRNEADNGLENTYATIAMARTNDPHSATSQFFINVKDNPRLNHTAPTARGWGYCVFGRVVSGIDTVEKIRSTPVQMDPRADHSQPAAPIEPVVIRKMERVKEPGVPRALTSPE